MNVERWLCFSNLFVKEENDGYRPEPPVVPNGFKEVEWFTQSVLTGILTQHHVVRRTGRHKDDGRHVIEALDPLASLVSLTAHVEHAAMNDAILRNSRDSFDSCLSRLLLEVDFVDLEPSLKDAGREDTAAENVLLCRSVVWPLDDVHPIQKATKQNIFINSLRKRKTPRIKWSLTIWHSQSAGTRWIVRSRLELPDPAKGSLCGRKIPANTNQSIISPANNTMRLHKLYTAIIGQHVKSRLIYEWFKQGQSLFAKRIRIKNRISLQVDNRNPAVKRRPECNRLWIGGRDSRARRAASVYSSLPISSRRRRREKDRNIMALQNNSTRTNRQTIAIHPY